MSTGSNFHQGLEFSRIVRTIEALRAKVETWRQEGLSIGFVPTMGGIHDGHLSLIRKSTAMADRTIASIFVNPTQFAAHEDLDTYPRAESSDVSALRQAGCDLVYCPSADEMYPNGFETEIKLPKISASLCGISRPHFFGGVASVVCKLLNQCMPDYAIFGEKDYQQLLVIKKMVDDLDMPVSIVGSPVIREADGLAMSSRNQNLSSKDRKIAASLNVQMRACIDSLKAGAPIDPTLANAEQALLAAGFTKIDYLALRSGNDLTALPNTPLHPNFAARIFAAAYLGDTRLIDNMPIFPAPPPNRQSGEK